MSRAFVVKNVASVGSVAKDKHIAAQRVRIANGTEMGNVQALPKARQSISTISTPQELAHAKHQTQAAQSARIIQLETELHNLWQHYASSRKQKLELLDANTSLETEICQLKKDLAYEAFMRAKAEAQLEPGKAKDAN